MSYTFALERKLLNQSFNQPTPEEYWHHLAKHKTNPKVYDSEKLEDMIIKTKMLVGDNCFDRKRSSLCVTALQVAYIYHNEAAINFLQDKTDKNALDIFSRNIFSYTTQIQHDQKLRTSSSPVNQQAILPPPIPLGQAPFHYRKGTNDFGKIIHTVILSTPSQELSQEYVIAGILHIAEQLGITVKLSPISCFPRDWAVYKGDGSQLFFKPDNLDFSQKAIMRAQFQQLYFEQKEALASFQHTGGPSLCGQTMEFLEKNEEMIATLCKTRDYSPIPFCEGGNFFCCSNRAGKQQVLIGAVHITQLHLELRKREWFKTNPPAGPTPQCSETKILQVAEEMFALGLLKLDNKQVLGDQSSIITLFRAKNALFDPSKKTYKEIAIENGLVPEFTLSSKNASKASPIVSNYIREQSGTYDFLASILHIPKDAIHSIPPFAAHLDCFMLPGPKGSIFLQSFASCSTILKKLIATDNLNAYQLTSDDYNLIIDYMATSAILEKQLEPQLQKIRSILEKAGFLVIPTPGNYFLDSKIPIQGAVNFLNALTGWSEKTHTYFYITTGASLLPTRVGRGLMDLFENFLKSYLPSLQVFYVGKNPQNPDDFTHAMNIWSKSNSNAHPTEGGVHCLTLEQESEDHID